MCGGQGASVLPSDRPFRLSVVFCRSGCRDLQGVGHEWGKIGGDVSVWICRWAGVEPEKDKYNETYLQNLVDLVNKLGENGIYTMLDFHQDIIS